MDTAAVKLAAKTNGWEPEDDDYVDSFWSVVEGFTEEERLRFVVFASASSRMPLKGWSDFRMQVQKNGSGDDRLPTAYTCFQLVLLPKYTSREVLRERLVQAIYETQGFGLS